MLAEDWGGGLLLADFSRRISKTTPKLLLLIWEHRKEKQPPYWLLCRRQFRRGLLHHRPILPAVPAPHFDPRDVALLVGAEGYTTAAQVAALPRELFDREPPRFSRNYLISRLGQGYRSWPTAGSRPRLGPGSTHWPMRSIPKQHEACGQRTGRRDAADPRMARRRA
jgi:hypothetical protein